MKILKSIYRSPIITALVYGLIALFALWTTNSSDIFFAIIEIGMSALLIITATQQNLIQKDNIKLQMFDKRYAVFETIAKSLEIASRKDYSNFILSGANDPFAINKLINEANSNLEKQTLLSQSLFERDVYAKIRSISDEFNEINKLHFKLYKENLKLSESDPRLFMEFGELFSKITFATTDDEIAKYNDELEKRFPYIYKTITDFNTAVAGYADFVKNTGVLTDFNKHLIIYNLDK